MSIKFIKKTIRIAQAERDTSLAKSKMYQLQDKPKSALVYAIRYEALELYINHLHKQLLAKEVRK